MKVARGKDKASRGAHLPLPAMRWVALAEERAMTGRIFRRFRAALPHELDGRLRKTDFPAYIERVAELELDQRELCKRVAYAVELMEQRAKPSKDEQDFIDMMREDGWV
jgi:hypothetical protein